MDPIKNRTSKIRVLNFSDLDLPSDLPPDLDSESTEAIVEEIRRYADLPFVYIVSRQKMARVSELLSVLKALRSPCYPYALFSVDGAAPEVDDPGLEIIHVRSACAETVFDRIAEYASARFHFDRSGLRIHNSKPMPVKVDVAVIGAGVTGLYAANRLMEAGIPFCILEKRDTAGGIWSMYANRSSRVNTSEPAYRLIEKPARCNRDHSDTREILEDLSILARNVSDHFFTETEVERIEKTKAGYRIRLNRGGHPSLLECKGVILAINDRVGTPREVRWKNQEAFQGKIVSGASDETQGLDWSDKKVVIVGMGAFAVENARTALEAGAGHVTVVCRRHGTVCPKIIDYLNFITPYDAAFKHDRKSNIRNMTYWKRLYELSGAAQPECWMGKIKHEGHTISVSDIWFIGHFLKKIETVTGSVTGMSENGIFLDGGRRIEADIVVNCIGFERNAPAAAKLSGCPEMYNHNYIDKDFMYLADAYIDGDAFNSLFGSSVLEMVKFYVDVFILFFGSPVYDRLKNIEGIKKIPIGERKWSHSIEGALALIRNHPGIHATAIARVAQRTNNFLQSHDLETYIAENKREWIDTHAMISGKPMGEKDCLPYVFEKLIELKAQSSKLKAGDTGLEGIRRIDRQLRSAPPH